MGEYNITVEVVQEPPFDVSPRGTPVVDGIYRIKRIDDHTLQVRIADRKVPCGGLYSVVIGNIGIRAWDHKTKRGSRI